MAIVAESIAKFSCGKCKTDIVSTPAEPLSTTACPHCGASVDVPGAVDNYVLVKRLGKGSTGPVYGAIDHLLNRKVAIKIFDTDLADDQTIEKCVRNAKTLASINHPNVARVYRLGETGDQHFVVTQLIEGKNAWKTLRPNAAARRPDEGELLDVAIKVAEGLKAAHDAGMVHCDVSPENILIDKSGTPHLIGFGIHSDDGKSTASPKYVSPEVVNKHRPNFHSDMFSLGATLFHLLTGRLPFVGNTPKQMMRKRLESPAPSVLDRRPDVSEYTADTIARLMATDPRQRFESWHELIDHLEYAHQVAASKSSHVDEPEEEFAPQWVEDEPTDAAVQLSGEISNKPAHSHVYEKKPSVVLPVVCGGIALLVLVGLIVLVTQSSDPPKSKQKLVKNDDTPPPDPVANEIDSRPAIDTSKTLKATNSNATAAKGESATQSTPKPLAPKPKPVPQKATIAKLPTDHTQGLIGYWSFDDHFEEASKTRHKALTNQDPTFIDGKRNRAWRLNGISDFAGVPSGLVNPVEGTISAWVNPDSIKGRHPIVGTKSSPCRYYLEVKDGTVFVSLGQKPLIFSAGSIKANRWQHVALTWQRNGEACIYANGQKVASQRMTESLTLPDDMRLGMNTYKPELKFIGGIDDLRFYKRAMSAQDIASLSGVKKVSPVAPKPNPIKPLENGLVAWWRFDQGLKDSSGNKHDLKPRSVTYVTGRNNQAARFDGRTHLPVDDALLKPAAGAIAVWFKPDPIDQTTTVFGSASAPSRYYIKLAKGKPSATHGRISTSFAMAPPGKENQWRHAVMTWNGKVVDFYVDGKLIKQRPSTGAAARNVTIGAYNRGEGQYFRGAVDEVRIYGRQLSATDVASLYKIPVSPKAPTATQPETTTTAPPPFAGMPDMKGLVVHLSFEPNAPAAVQAAGKPKAVQGRIGKTAADLSSGSFQMPGTSTTEFTQVTAMAWVKVSQFKGEYDPIICKGDNSWRLQRDDKTNRIEFSVDPNARDKGIDAKSRRDLNDNKWHHLAGVCDGKKVMLYVDGQLEASTNYKGRIPHVLMPITIGRNAERPTRHFAGQIDDVYIFRRALAQDEIRALAQIDAALPLVAANRNNAKTKATAKAKPKEDEKSRIARMRSENRIYLNLGGNDVTWNGNAWKKASGYRKGGHGYVGGKGVGSKKGSALGKQAIEGFSSIKFTVPNGYYKVAMLFEENWMKTPRARIFKITVGTRNFVFDSFSEFGYRRLRVVQAGAFVTNGMLEVKGKAGNNATFMNAISVEYVRPLSTRETAKLAAADNKDIPDLAEKPKPKVPDVTEKTTHPKPAPDPAAKEEAQRKKKEALAAKALAKAEDTLKKDKIDGYEKLESITKRFRGTESAAKAAQKMEEIMSDPKQSRMIRSEQKERAAADDLKVCKSYIQAKRYKVAYDKLRDLIKDSGRTRAAVEARVLLEEMRKKLDE